MRKRGHYDRSQVLLCLNSQQKMWILAKINTELEVNIFIDVGYKRESRYCTLLYSTVCMYKIECTYLLWFTLIKLPPVEHPRKVLTSTKRPPNATSYFHYVLCNISTPDRTSRYFTSTLLQRWMLCPCDNMFTLFYLGCDRMSTLLRCCLGLNWNRSRCQMWHFLHFRIFSWLKGTVQQKLRWVKSGINR
jgi:hypothetical protein